MKVEKILLDLIDAPEFAHRVDMDELALNELADSIKNVGLIQPIIVRANENGRYEIIAGHRRYMAHRINQATHIDGVITTHVGAHAEAIKAVENLQRADLSPMEEARAIDAMMAADNKSIDDIARQLNRSPTWVESRVELLALPDDLCQMVHTGTLAVATARYLAEVTEKQHRRYLTTYALDSGASARVIREWVSQWKIARDAGDPSAAPVPDPVVFGQEVVVTMPCATCGEAHDHRNMIIMRVCRTCAKEIAQS
jgi:ParB family chromosome partitioning protein